MVSYTLLFTFDKNLKTYDTPAGLTLPHVFIMFFSLKDYHQRQVYPIHTDRNKGSDILMIGTPWFMLGFCAMSPNDSLLWNSPLSNLLHLIIVWSCGYYYKVQGWTHVEHMVNTSISFHLIYNAAYTCLSFDLLCIAAQCVMEQPLVLSHLILSTMPLLSYQMNYPTLQFGCYGTALYLIFYIQLLFGLVDIIIRFDSCLALLHTADSMPSHYFILLTLKPYPYSAKLYSYTAISLYVLSFIPYLLIFLSSYLWLIW